MVDSSPKAPASPKPVKQPPPLFRSPKRIDWGTSQTESEDIIADKEINAQDDIFTTPPSKQIRSGTPTPKGLAAVSNGTDVPASSRVYDIPTLLQLSGSLAGIGVFAKIRPEALAENLFQYIGASRPLPMGPRTRALSELSNPSRRSFGSQSLAHPAYPPRSYTLPPRQSLAPPEALSRQQKEGFARFLKQHASPPHHRVTAGGRIVPTGPLSPPPMFDYESLTGLIRRQEEKFSETNTLGDASNRVPANSTVLSLSSRPMGPTDNRTKMWNNLRASDPPEFLPQRDSHGIVTGGNFPDPSLPAVPESMSLIPVSTLEDGSTISSCNGMYYRTYWNGIGTVVEPLPTNPGHISTGTQTEPSVPFASNQFELSEGKVPLRTAGIRAPLREKTNQSQTSGSQSQTQELEAQHAAMNFKLHNLDRHMALHHYEISHEERASFVSQRRALVEEMDKLRRMKDPPHQNLPTLSHRVFSRRASTREPSISTRKASYAAGAPLMPARPITIETKNATPRKGLSPSAPPFIPSSMKSAVTRDFGTDSALDTSLHKEIAVPSSSSELRHSASAQKQQLLEAQRLHDHEGSLDRDSIDPAMRIIHNSDVEYAAHLAHNDDVGQKRYCTTVSEFQEAVRQVRQQARLYGCAGGSSKDPAYDAEQDIWWAICDHDPIPLPPKTPDHVSHARPWDWNNSLFNFRISEHSLPEAKKRSIPLSDPSSKETTFSEKVRKSSGTQKPTLVNLLQAAPERSVSGTSSHYSTHATNTANLVSRSRSLSKEYREIQKAIEALSRRCDAIMGDVKERGVIAPPNTPSKRLASDTLHYPAVSHGENPSGFPSTKQAKIDDKAMNPDNPISVDEATRNNVTASQSANIARNLRDTKPPADFPMRGVRAGPFPFGPKTMTTSVKARQADRIPERGSSSSKDATADTLRITPANRLSDTKASSKFVEDISIENPSEEAMNKPPQQKSRVTSKGDLFARAKSQISPQKAAKKAKELYSKSRTKSHKNQKALMIETATPPQPRVHLPAHDKDHLKDKSASSDASKRTLAPGSNTPDFHSSEVKSITLTNPPNDRFLREMIKGLRSASARTSNALSPKHNKRPHIKIVMGADDLKYSVNKENAEVEAEQSSSQVGSKEKVEPFEASEYQNVLTAKAPSSLAASDYHARGFLPQYDGEGKAQATTLTQQHGVPTFHRQARVKLPLSSSYDDRPTPISTRSTYVGEVPLAHERHVSWVTTDNDTSEDGLVREGVQRLLQGHTSLVGKENMNRLNLHSHPSDSPNRTGSPIKASAGLATLLENSPEKSRMRQGTKTE